MSQYTIISKYGRCTRQLKFKQELKIFPPRNNGACFAPELNEKEITELVENPTLGSKKKATKYGMNIFHGKKFESLF